MQCRELETILHGRGEDFDALIESLKFLKSLDGSINIPFTEKVINCNFLSLKILPSTKPHIEIEQKPYRNRNNSRLFFLLRYFVILLNKLLLA